MMEQFGVYASQGKTWLVLYNEDYRGRDDWKKRCRYLKEL